MIRKFIIAAAAIATLGTASLAVSTTQAEAGGWRRHHGHFHGFHGFRHVGFYGPAIYGGYYDSCLRRTWVINRFGESVLRTINVCY
jgi:hypothetical protein